MSLMQSTRSRTPRFRLVYSIRFDLMERWLRRWRLFLVFMVMPSVAFLAVGTAAADAATFTYDAPAIARVDVHASAVADAESAQLRGSREGFASPAVEARGTSTTPSSFNNATEAGGVLKGAIPDAVPANLTQQLALTEARASGGAQIMANLADNPRLVAVYGEGEWVKMQSVLRGTDVNTTVHWFKNLTTGLEVEFKFK